MKMQVGVETGKFVANVIRESADRVAQMKNMDGTMRTVVSDLRALAWIAENHPDVVSEAYAATKVER